MPWHHERVMDDSIPPLRIRDYLVSDDGVRVEPIGARDQWVFRYTHGELQFDFSAVATTPSERNYERFAPLGPKCIVGLQGNAAQIAKCDDITKSSITKNITEALLAHHMLPASNPPHVKKVVFNKIVSKALNHQQG